MGILKKVKKNIAALMAAAMIISFASNIAIKANAQTNSIPEGKKVVGYFTDWTDMNVNDVQYDKLTHINYAFLTPMEDGNVKPFEQESKLRDLITKAHANGVKVLVSVGGFSYENKKSDPVFAKAASTDATRQKLIDNILQCVNSYNFDGADIHWEYPDPGTEADNYLKLMQGLNSKLKPNGKILTTAVVAGNSVTEQQKATAITNDIFDLVDFLNVMAYDGSNNKYHCSYSYAKSSMIFWSEEGLPKEKMVLGIPFYAKEKWMGYKGYNEIVKNDPEAPNKDESDYYYYNGIDTVKQKAKLALRMGSGVMVWELSQDTNDSTSLLNAIYSVFTSKSATTKPSTVSVFHDNNENSDSYHVKINVPTNNNAEELTLYENNKRISTAYLDGTTNKLLVKTFQNKSPGVYKYDVTTRNLAGVTYSDYIIVVVGDNCTTTATPAHEKDREDVNNDGMVDVLDFAIVSTFYNVQSTDSNYNDKFDVNKDEIIDIFDMVAVSLKVNFNASPFFDEGSVADPDLQGSIISIDPDDLLFMD